MRGKSKNKSSIACVGRELGQGIAAGVDGQLLKFAREVELDGRLDLLGAQCLLLGVDHELASLPHDFLKKLDDDRVDQDHALLGDTHLGFGLLQHSEDVGLEGALVSEGDLLLHRLLGLSCHHSRGADIEFRVLGGTTYRSVEIRAYRASSQRERLLAPEEQQRESWLSWQRTGGRERLPREPCLSLVWFLCSLSLLD